MTVRLVMHRDLADVPAPWADADGPDGAHFEGPGRTAAELVPAFERAYPVGHPDHERGWDPEEEERRILSGEECGPLLDATRFAVAGHTVVGAALITDAPGNRHIGPGLLVADVFRHPDPVWRGLGATLLRRSLAAAASAGHARMGLLVTLRNEPALRTYAALGFLETGRFER
jgi:GNAT superfamily N-acetyltransferase